MVTNLLINTYIFVKYLLQIFYKYNFFLLYLNYLSNTEEISDRAHVTTLIVSGNRIHDLSQQSGSLTTKQTGLSFDKLAKPRGVTCSTTRNANNVKGQSWSGKSSLSYSLYYQLFAIERPVKIGPFIPEICRNEQAYRQIKITCALSKKRLF